MLPLRSSALERISNWQASKCCSNHCSNSSALELKQYNSLSAPRKTGTQSDKNKLLAPHAVELTPESMLVAPTEPCHVVGDGLLAVMTSHLRASVGLARELRLRSMFLCSARHTCTTRNRLNRWCARAGHYNFRQNAFCVPVVCEKAVHPGQSMSSSSSRPGSPTGRRVMFSHAAPSTTQAWPTVKGWTSASMRAPITIVPSDQARGWVESR